MDDAQRGFAAFYSDYYNMLDFLKAIQALNASIDFTKEIEPRKKKVEFFIMTAEHSFDEVFNSERGPVNFRRIVDKMMPPRPDIPQELRVEKVKGWFRKKGEELKPETVFLF